MANHLVDHLSLQCTDFDASAAFYDQVLAILGARRILDISPHAIGYGVQGPEFWIGPVTVGDGFRESHIAFTADDRPTVDAFFAAATALGAEVLHEPREWPEYTDEHVTSYYAAFVRDPDGNNIEACTVELATA